MAIIINGTSGISGVDGSAGTPALQGLDPNTGISFGTDTVNLVTGGTTRATVDSSGNIDLGPLVINGSASDDSVNLDASGRLLIGTSSTRSLGFSCQTQIEGVTNATSSLSIVNNQNSAEPPYLVFGKSRAGSIGGVTSVSSDDYIGIIRFAAADGTDTSSFAAEISCQITGGPGSNNTPGSLLLSTTAVGATSPTEALRLYPDGSIKCFGAYNGTTGLSPNAVFASNGYFARSTSSIKYKTDVETLENSYADALLDCRPVWYHSLCENDNPGHSYWGFIAEEVAAIDPRLVHWKTFEVTYDEDGSAVEAPCDPEPEGVQYDRFVPHLINLIKRQKEQLESQAATIAALDARLTALEGGAAQ